MSDLHSDYQVVTVVGGYAVEDRSDHQIVTETFPEHADATAAQVELETRQDEAILAELHSAHGIDYREAPLSHLYLVVHGGTAQDERDAARAEIYRRLHGASSVTPN